MLFGAMNFPVVPVLQEIETFAQLGFDYLELAMDPPMAHHQVIGDQRQEIRAALAKHELGLVCHLPTFLSTADLAEAIRIASAQEMHDSLLIAAELGAKKVVLHPSMVFGMGGHVLDTVREYSFAFISAMVNQAKQLDITICLENMMPHNILGVDPPYFQQIFQEFPDLKLTLDTGHANLGDPAGIRLKELVHHFPDRLEHIHISDNYGMRDDHLAVGQGTVDFKNLVRELKKIGYNNTITLEVFSNDRRDLVESRKKLQKMFKKM